METDDRFGFPHINSHNFIKLHWYCFYGILLNDKGEQEEREPVGVGPCQNHFPDYPNNGLEPRYLSFKRHVMGAIKLAMVMHDARTYQSQHDQFECPEAYFSDGGGESNGVMAKQIYSKHIAAKVGITTKPLDTSGPTGQVEKFYLRLKPSDRIKYILMLSKIVIPQFDLLLVHPYGAFL